MCLWLLFNLARMEYNLAVFHWIVGAYVYITLRSFLRVLMNVCRDMWEIKRCLTVTKLINNYPFQKSIYTVYTHAIKFSIFTFSNSCNLCQAYYCLERRFIANNKSTSVMNGKMSYLGVLQIHSLFELSGYPTRYTKPAIF